MFSIARNFLLDNQGVSIEQSSATGWIFLTGSAHVIISMYFHVIYLLIDKFVVKIDHTPRRTECINNITDQVELQK